MKFNSFDELMNTMQKERIGYFPLHISSDGMPDKKSKKLFEKADKALKEFRDYVINNLSDDYK